MFQMSSCGLRWTVGCISKGWIIEWKYHTRLWAGIILPQWREIEEVEEMKMERCYLHQWISWFPLGKWEDLTEAKGDTHDADELCMKWWVNCKLQIHLCRSKWQRCRGSPQCMCVYMWWCFMCGCMCVCLCVCVCRCVYVDTHTLQSTACTLKERVKKRGKKSSKGKLQCSLEHWEQLCEYVHWGSIDQSEPVKRKGTLVAHYNWF